MLKYSKKNNQLNHLNIINCIYIKKFLKYMYNFSKISNLPSKISMKLKVFKYKNSYILCILMMLLNGCSNLIIMHPQGKIGLEERTLILTAFGLMLIVVIPVIVMTILCCIKYRSSNTKNVQYNPNWNQSKKIEFIIWFIPIIIIIMLSILTWKSTHKLDPKNPILQPSNVTPITVDVISLDWKWLFIYPKYKIATINELVFPKDTPIKFNVTSNSVMNAFFIPQLGSQIYAMAGMHTKLYLVANKSGKYQGISSNFSGSGFSSMKFIVTVSETEKEFNQWIKQIKTSNNQINDMSTYEALSKPSKYHPITYFSSVKENLFFDVIKKF